MSEPRVNGVTLDELESAIANDGYTPSSATILDLISEVRRCLFLSRCDRQDQSPLRCMGCLKPYSEFGLDIVLPDHQWGMISDRPNGGGVLCAQCIVDRARLRGATVVRAWLESDPTAPFSRPQDHLLRVAVAAAELLERDAYALKECSTLDGDWGCEFDAKRDYELMTRTARELRYLCR